MDASGSPYELSEEMSRRRMQDAGVVLTATNTVMAKLAQDWSSPEGQQLVQLLFTEVLPRWPPDRGRIARALGGRGRAVRYSTTNPNASVSRVHVTSTFGACDGPQSQPSIVCGSPVWRYWV